MKKILLASAVVVAFAGAARSADVVATEPELAPAGFSWTGAYVGVQAGNSWGDANADYVNPFVWPTSHDPAGFLGGVYVGYNYQFSNNIVLGLDADIAWSGANSEFKDFPGLVRTMVDVDYTAAGRVRLGYAVDRWLPYVAGGIAVSRAEFGYDMTVSDAAIKDTLVGWTLGGGVELAATDNLILRAEYRYSDFGSGKEHMFAGFPNHYARYDLKSHDIRVGFAYKF
ncbi:Opacity protein antigen [Aminobacter sp. MSH1]|uniref:outer membrane protein n=1 Tax=Aminobacter sp. MSH1 TaxID=374606 RepID=UPI000D3C3F88|nr:outer membrane protein [Aminobacter sp. MSH1]AWC20855.1 Opacity protein antigen [Aminobacter sp. MSH1]